MKNAKKILTFILAITMILNMSVGIFAAQDTVETHTVSDADEIAEIISAEVRNSEEKVVGDINGDGTLNSADAIYLLRHTIMSDKYPITGTGDMNGDGILNSADAIYLLRHTIMPDKYPITSQDQESEYENGFDIYDLTVDTEENTFSAQISTLRSCKLLVRFIDEDIYFAPEYPENKVYIDDGELYAETMIDAAENAVVSAEIIGTLPEKFVAEAVLVDENNENLSKPFVILTHSEKYEAFQNVTADDFEEDDIVIEYDDGSNNLVVLADDVKSLTAASIVTQYSEDGTNIVYRIQNPSKKIQVGDKVYVTASNDETGILLKVASVSSSNGFVTITPDETVDNFLELYQFLRFDGVVENAMSSDEEVSYVISEKPSATEKISFTLPTLALEYKDNDTGVKASFRVENQFDIAIKVHLAVDARNTALEYFECKLVLDETTTSTYFIEASKDGIPIQSPKNFSSVLDKIRDKLKWSIPIKNVPGLTFYGKLDFLYEWEFSGGAEFVVRSHSITGCQYTVQNGLTKVEELPRVTQIDILNLKGSITAKIGPELTVGIREGYENIKIPSINENFDAFIQAEVRVFLGAEVTGTLTGTLCEADDDADGHLCDVCVDGSISGVFYLDGEIKGALGFEDKKKPDLDSDDDDDNDEKPKQLSLSLTKRLFNIKKPLFEFYAHISGPWEISNDKIGLGECPNRKNPGLEYRVNEDKVTCTVTGIGDFKGTELDIPSTLDGYRVTSIGEFAFDGCSSLQSISIPNSVTSIGGWAFCNCSSLQSIIIPDSVTIISEGTFYGCTSLQNVEIPNSVKLIDFYAFKECVSLQSITIPNSVTAIWGWAFCDCSSLRSITIPNSVISIGELAFDNCSSLQSVKIGNSVTNIGRYVFKGCTSLQSITIPDSVTSIGEYAFDGCSSLQSITIPNSVTSIGERAFQGCSSLQSITIPNSVTSIGIYAFYDCISLQSVKIGNSVTSIGLRAFYGCSSLQSITIPDSVTSIGHDTFRNCTSLQSVKIGNSVTSIDERAFQGCSSLRSITIPDSVTSIGVRAFYDCSSLQSITIPDSVTSIGERAFRNCTSLQSVKIGNSVTSIGEYAFYDCSSLQSITIPNSVTSIGESAFSDCSNLRSATIGNQVKIIGDWAFYNCSSLQSVKIGNSVTSIGEFAFAVCSSLQSITIPNGVTSIGESTFNGCSSLQSITIPNRVTSIGELAFNGCSSLQSITIPDSVTSIGDYAFYNCSSLQSVKIGNSVTSIGEGAFYNCASLTNVSMSDWQESLFWIRFYGTPIYDYYEDKYLEQE